MTDSITATGLVATELRDTTTSEGLRIVSFRLASSQRRFNKTENVWEYGPTNWFTVSTFRHLAENIAASIKKGDRVVVTGRLRIRTWEKDGKSGTVVEIDADAIGPDLMWGTAAFTRAVTSSSTSTASTSADGANADATTGAEAPAASSGFDPDEGNAAATNGATGWAVTEQPTLTSV